MFSTYFLTYLNHSPQYQWQLTITANNLLSFETTLLDFKLPIIFSIWIVELNSVIYLICDSPEKSYAFKIDHDPKTWKFPLCVVYTSYLFSV